MHNYAWTVLVTLLALIVYFAMAMAVGHARWKYKVAAPATTGDPMFERYFRVHMNMLEWLPIFLPSLWLFAFYWGDQIAASLGAVWVIGRIFYMTSYVRDPKARGAGFGAQGLAALALLIGALVGAAQGVIASLAG